MRFALDGVSSATLPGVEAGLLEWPSLPGVEIDSVRAPGSEGRTIGEASNERARFVFDVTVDGDSMEELFERAAQFAAFVDPRRGPRRLDPTGDSGWEYPEAVVVAEITWTSHGDFMRGEVVFECDPFARPVTDESWGRSGAGAIQVKRTKGSMRSYPTIEVEGRLTATQSFTIAVGAYRCRVNGPLAAGEVARLDFDKYEFARWNGTTKVASLVQGMSNLDRIELWPDQTYTVSVSSTGTVSKVTVFPNSKN